MDLRRRASLSRALALAGLLAIATATASASAATSGTDTPGSTATGSAVSEGASGHRLTRAEAIGVAERADAVAETRERYGKLSTFAAFEAPVNWKVSFYADGGERAQVLVSDATGEVAEAWTGHQVAWQMARGYPGAFGHVLNAPYVWLPLAALFVLLLMDWRRPRRMAHLDLLVLLSFGISNHFLTRAEIGLSVPLAYPPLLYLLVRALWIGFQRTPRRGAGLRPSAPTFLLVVVTAFLLTFRVSLNVVDSGVIDVGYAGVIGADRIAHGEPIYGEGAFPANNPFGDTYGPANYLAYVPFELVAPWGGEWDSLPAAHGAAIFFDLAAVMGLFVLGTRLWPGAPGRRAGVVLAFAWAAYPYTAYALQSNSNDSLLAALLIWAVALFGRPVARGALLAVAIAVKFAPLALVPLFATGERGVLERPAESPRALLRRLAPFAAALLAATTLLLAHPAVEPGLATFWDRTIGNQLDRSSPFSVWGQETGLGWLQAVTQVFAIGLAVSLLAVPGRRTVQAVAALSAAVLIALQIPAEHWFYLYIPWFFGLYMAAIVAPEERAEWPRTPRPAAGAARSSWPGRRP